MLISLAPPPLAPLHGVQELCMRDGVAGSGELCQRESIAGLGQGLDPISAVSTAVASVVGSAASFFNTKAQAKIAKKQIGLETQQLKAQKEEAARQFAMQQVEAIKGPIEAHIMDQKLALIAVGGVALLIAGVFLVSTVKLAKKEKK